METAKNATEERERITALNNSKLKPLEMHGLNSSNKSSPQAVRTELSDTDIYIEAKRFFDRGFFEIAREKFKELLNKYPRSSRGDSAQFWIAESYYEEAWYEKSILEYQKVIEKYPNGNKVAAALLKQGWAFLRLGDKVTARLTLKDLVHKYPTSIEALVARKKLHEINGIRSSNW